MPAKHRIQGQEILMRDQTCLQLEVPVWASTNGNLQAEDCLSFPPWTLSVWEASAGSLAAGL